MRYEDDPVVQALARKIAPGHHPSENNGYRSETWSNAVVDAHSAVMTVRRLGGEVVVP